MVGMRFDLERRQLLERWLDENVLHYSTTPKLLTIRDIRLDRTKLSGDFALDLDGAPVPHRFSLYLGGAGHLCFRPPVRTSPVGAPGTYRIVDLTDETFDALQAAVATLLPRLMGYGLQPGGGPWITQSTPLAKRIIDDDVFAAAYARITSANFEISWPCLRP